MLIDILISKTAQLHGPIQSAFRGGRQVSARNVPTPHVVFGLIRTSEQGSSVMDGQVGVASARRAQASAASSVSRIESGAAGMDIVGQGFSNKGQGRMA